MTLPYGLVLGSFSSRIFILIALLGASFSDSTAQGQPEILIETPVQTPANSPLLVVIQLLKGEMVERVNLLYRAFGSSEYTRVEMDLRGDKASAVIPATDVRTPFVEYYLVLETRQGTIEAYPLSEGGNPYSQPPQKTLQVAVRNEGEPDDQVIFLSPDPNSLVPADELVISISLLRADSTVDRQATQVFLDGANITSNTILSDDLIVYAPENFSYVLSPGHHTVTVLLFDGPGKLYRNTSISFTSFGTSYDNRTGPGDIRYIGSIQLESRFERITGIGTWFNRASATLGAGSGDWRAKSNLFISSDESSTRQPQNRYFFGLESPWLEAGYGDGFPSFPGLILSGKRVRGLHSSLALGVLNVDMTLGKTTRGVEGQLLKTIDVDTLGLEQQRDPNAAYAPIDQHTWGKFSYGVYERDLFAIRPSIGSGRTWQLGFTWLKSRDDLSSISYGVKPQENLVVGSDFVVRLLDNALELSGQGAFSAFNSDISSGNFTDAYIDSVYAGDAADIKKVRDILDGFITVNDNLRPLSLKRLATLAYEVGLGLKLFDNSIKGTYLYRGSEYNSFGQTFLRKDIRGFNIVDRFRMVNNQVFLTLGYERLEDNTSRSKPATTVYSNINAAVSYYPRIDFPSFTFGYSYFANDNDLFLTDPNVTNERTNRVYVQSSYGFDLGIHHVLNMGYSNSFRNDGSVRGLDVKNSTFGFGVSSQFRFPLQTRINYSLNLSKIPQIRIDPLNPGTTLTNFDYSTLMFSGRYEVVKNVVTLSSAVSPTFGDIERQLVTFGGEWVILQTVTVLLDYSYYHLNAGSNDVIWTARLRYDL